MSTRHKVATVYRSPSSSPHTVQTIQKKPNHAFVRLAEANDARVSYPVTVEASKKLLQKYRTRVVHALTSTAPVHSLRNTRRSDPTQHPRQNRNKKERAFLYAEFIIEDHQGVKGVLNCG